MLGVYTTTVDGNVFNLQINTVQNSKLIESYVPLLCCYCPSRAPQRLLLAAAAAAAAVLVVGIGKKARSRV